MKPKILVIGDEQDYYEIEVNRTRLNKKISEMGIAGIIKEEGLLNNLRTNNKIPANQLRNYGATVPLKEETLASETIMDGLERFFEKARRYAKKHNAPYVLIQDLKLTKRMHLTYDILGLAQLLID